MIAAGGLAVAVSAAALVGGSLTLAEISGPGWQARDLEMQWRWDAAERATIDLAIGRLELAGTALDELTLHCDGATLAGDTARCREAELAFVTSEGVPVRGTIAIDYELASGALSVALEALDLCAGRLRGSVAVGAGWRTELRGESLELPCLARLGGLGERLRVDITGGTVDGEVNVASSGQALELDLAVTDLNFGNGDGTVAGESLAGRAVASLRRDGNAWRGTVELEADRGVIYRDPVLLEAGTTPLALRITGVADLGGGIDLEALELTQGEALRVSGRLAVEPQATAPTSVDVDFSSRDLDAFYVAWIQPYLIGTVLDELDLSGVVSGHARLGEKGWAVGLELDGLALVDGRGRFSLGGLEGSFAWGGPEAPASRLRWKGGHVLQLAVGAAETEFTLRDGAIRLLRPLRQPLVDGALVVSALEADAGGGSGPRIRLEAELEPLSLEALSYAFGWPVMAGELGGKIPTLTFADDTLAVDGSLSVDVFDGSIRILEPRLERPLGPVAALEADVVVDGIDLALLTRTFPIGRIEGRLAGRIDDLLLHDWRPVRFDAEFATPPDDDSRRRISQRAVDSITSLGGLSGALSRSALRFFDEFRYSRLGFRCRLRGTVCELGGVEPAESGYYLVKGGGLPRIDIIGHVREVDWPELIDRVKRAMEEGSPVVN